MPQMIIAVIELPDEQGYWEDDLTTWTNGLLDPQATALGVHVSNASVLDILRGESLRDRAGGRFPSSAMENGSPERFWHEGYEAGVSALCRKLQNERNQSNG